MGLWGREGSRQTALCPGTSWQLSSPRSWLQACAVWSSYEIYPELCQWPQCLVSNWRQTAKEEENLPFPPSQQRMLRTAPAHPRIQHQESWPRLSFSRQTQHFICTFFRLDARKALCCLSAGQGRAAARLQALSPFTLCLPVAACEPQDAASSLMRAAVPWHSPFCSHAGNSAAATQIFPPIQSPRSKNPGWLVSTENRSSKSLQGHILWVQRIAQSGIWLAYGTPGGPPGNFSLMVKAAVWWGQH